jgi:hypothetical protein
MPLNFKLIFEKEVTDAMAAARNRQTRKDGKKPTAA